MKLAAFDVETRGVDVGYGLQPFRAKTGEAWLTMCAIASEAGVVGRMRPTTEWLRKWLRGMSCTKTRIVGWNTPFDMAWLIALGLRDEVFACDWLDGMNLWRHLTASPEWTGLAPKSYGLKAAVAEHLSGFAGYEEGIDFETDDPEELAKLLTYNKKDALFTLTLATGFLRQMTEAQKRCALIEAACLPMVAEAMVEGIVADRDAAQELAVKLDEQAKVAMVKLVFETGDSVDEAILASPIKLRKLLYKDWGLPVVKFTDKGAESTDRDALTQLAPLDNRAGLLNEFREARNNRTKFALGAVNSLDYNGDGRVRPSPKVYGTYTGRMTYGSKILRGKDERPTGVALHQWKRAKDFRDIIVVPDGYTLLEFDFAGQEFRWMAVMSKDPTMLGLCEPGEDAHGYMGARIGDWRYNDIRKVLADIEHADYQRAKDLRQLGKVANLSLQYRTSPNALIRVARTGYQMNLSTVEAKAIHGTYRMTYPNVQRYWERQIKDARIQGWVETVAGRRVHVGQGATWVQFRELEDGRIEASDNTWGCESTAINFPIQGSGADQKYLALLMLKDYLPRVNGRFYFELHDGLFVIVPDAYAERAVAEIKPLLSTLPYKKAWGVDLPIQFPVDAKMGKTWGQLKEVK